VSAVAATPCALFQVDEIGRVLRAIAESRHAPHLTHIITVLMRLYSSSNSFFRSDAYADASRNLSINQPHACLWGTTVPKSFLESLSTESVTDGFISRLLVFEAPSMIPLKQRPATIQPPQPLLDSISSWLKYSPSGGNLNTHNPSPTIWPTDPDAAEIFDHFNEEAEARLRNEKDEFASIWSRTVEKARKLALIHICSRGTGHDRVDSDAAIWGCAVADYLTKRIVFLASQWVAENYHERKVNQVYRIICDGVKTASEGISLSYLARRLQSIPTKERLSIIEDLCAAHRIEKKIIQTSKKPKTLLRPLASLGEGLNSLNNKIHLPYVSGKGG
jgi:hypothetical protein